MTDILRIVEQFTMTVEGPPPGRDSWFLDYVLRSPKQAGKHLTAGWMALCSVLEVYQSFQEFESCREYFGGMGAQALMVQELFAPALHTVMDYSPEAVRHMRRVLPEHVAVARADAYLPETARVADLVMLDFGDLTAWRTRDGEQHRLLLDRVFAREPKAVVFTDVACRYLHLHRERYESLLGPGTCGSYETYLAALLARLNALYGYSLVGGFQDRWSTVMALVPDELADGLNVEVVPTPDRPVGLELL